MVQHNISYAFEKKIKDYLKEQILKYLGYFFKKHITNMNCTPVMLRVDFSWHNQYQ